MFRKECYDHCVLEECVVCSVIKLIKQICVDQVLIKSCHSKRIIYESKPGVCEKSPHVLVTQRLRLVHMSGNMAASKGVPPPNKAIVQIQLSIWQVNIP